MFIALRFRHGWWEDQPLVRVVAVAANERAAVDDVKATAFMQPHDHAGGLIAVGNFGNSSVTVTLSLSTHALPHTDAEPGRIAAYTNVQLVADRIEAFQAAQTFAAGAAIAVPAKGGYLLRLVV